MIRSYTYSNLSCQNNTKIFFSVIYDKQAGETVDKTYFIIKVVNNVI